MTATAAPRFWSRRRVAAWTLIAVLLFACGAALHDRLQTQRTVALIERIDKLGGHVRYYREYDAWQRNLPDFLDGILGRDTYSVGLSKAAPTADDLRGVAAIPHLRHLDLTDATGVDDAALAALGDATGVVELELAGTGATDDGVRALAGLTRLVSIGLDDTRVTDDALAALLRMPSLRFISVGGTRVTAVTGEDIAVVGPLTSGGPVTITGAVVVREPPPVTILGVFAQLCQPGRRHGRDLGATMLKPQAGPQRFTLSGKVHPCEPGRYVLTVNARVAVPAHVTYRLLRTEVDVLPPTADPDAPAKND